MAEPRIDVLLPVRDARPTLSAALRSVARQCEARFRCWVLDDGSRDGSADLAHAVARSDPRFRVLGLPRRGIVPALQIGLEHCRAPYVARMDADDLMHRDRLARQLAALEAQPELAGVGAHVRLFPRAQVGPGMRAYERWLNAIATPADVIRESFVECPIAHPTLVLRREVIHRFGWSDGDWPEDYELLLRLLAAGLPLAVVPQRLLAWRQGAGRLSQRDPRYGTDRFVACKAAFLTSGFLRDAPDYGLWGYGGTGRALRRALLVHRREPSYIVEVHPGRIGNAIHGAPVVEPERLRTLPRRPLVVSVSGAGPRTLIRTTLAELGFQETRDFVCAA